MTKNNNGFVTFVQFCSNLLASLGTCVALAVAFLIFYDIVMRLAFGRPFVGTTDMVAVTLLIVTFTQAPRALLLGKFLEVTALTAHLPEKLRRGMACLGNLLGAAIFFGLALMSIDSIEQAVALQEFFGSDAFRIPTAPIRVGITATWVVFTMAFIVMAQNALKGDTNE